MEAGRKEVMLLWSRAHRFSQTQETLAAHLPPMPLSLRRMWFSPGWEIETQAAFWRKNILSARRAGLGRPDYMEVHYEDLILKPRAVLERICAFAGLSYDDSLLTYYTR